MTEGFDTQESIASTIFGAREEPRRIAQEAERKRRGRRAEHTPADDSPVAIVFGPRNDEPSSSGGRWRRPAVSVALAVAAHLLLTGLAWSGGMGAYEPPEVPEPDEPMTVSTMTVPTTTEPPPEPEPEPTPQPAEPEPEPTPKPEPLQPEPAEPEPSPPEPQPADKPSPKPKEVPAESTSDNKAAPAPAQAGEVVSQDSPDSQVADFTDFEMTEGSGDDYAGGVTASDGTSTESVGKDEVHEDGVADGTGEGPASGSPARPAGTDWDCTWPKQARSLSTDEETVTLRVNVKADGTPTQATVLSNPGHGFGRAARRCALSRSYQPATNRSGQAISAQTPPIRVRFTR